MNWYKATGPGGSAMFGTGTWNLPTADGPGEWMPYLHGELIPCMRGYHVTDAAHIGGWIGPEIYLAEVDPGGVLLSCVGDKWVTPVARLTKRLSWDANTAMQFIEDCDQHVGGMPSLYYDAESKKAARQSLAPGSDDPNWSALDAFLTDCRRFHGNSNFPLGTAWNDVFALRRKRTQEERLWQNQRLLMYLHGAIA